LVAITVILPDKALEDLGKKAKSEGKSLEELVGEAVFKQLDIADPEAKSELHLKLCEKYMCEAEELLEKRTTPKRLKKLGMPLPRWLKHWLRRKVRS
jgi:hypothetical protein